MNAITPFAFDNNLVRMVEKDGEPWFIGHDVCHALAIANVSDALSELDDDERLITDIIATTDTMGRVRNPILVSEAGVYRLIFRSRKPEAERFKRWLAHDVLPTLRRTGSYAMPGAPPPSPPSRDHSAEPLMHRLQLLREARSIFGRPRAQVLWAELGLPTVPPPPPTDVNEAQECLHHLLNADLDLGMTMRRHIEAALDEDLNARETLVRYGVRAFGEQTPEGFVVANRHEWLEKHYAKTAWTNFCWSRVLRRLPEVTSFGATRFGGHQGRCTFLPARYLDAGKLS